MAAVCAGRLWVTRGEGRNEKSRASAGESGPFYRKGNAAKSAWGGSRVDDPLIAVIFGPGPRTIMVTSALACDGVVLIAWQHQEITLKTKTGEPGISQEILTQTGATSTFNVPTYWPTDPAGGARDDLVFVFDRPSRDGPISGFTLFPQQLLAADLRNI